MIIETTGKFVEVCIPYRQITYKPYVDCYGIYKFAKRTSDNYIELCQTEDFTSSYNTDYKRSITRHRWIYQNEVGELSSDILIHHINHVKGDDRPENLEPVTRKKHKQLHNRNTYISYNSLKKYI